MRALATVLLALPSACSALASVSAAPSATPAWTPDSDHVFRARPGTPPGAEHCRDQGEVEAVLRQFAVAFNSGDPDAMRATLSEEFWAISFPHGVAYTRNDAVRFVVERQGAGERLEFRHVQVNGLVGWDGAAHVGPVEFALLRSGETIHLSGKGALFCGGSLRGIKVLGLGASST